MKRWILLIILFLSLIAVNSFAQESNCNNNLDDDGDGLVDCRDGDCPGKVCEICDNGIDDDGDRFIDCYDKECTIDAACSGFFIGKDVTCNVKPDSFPPFEMKIKFKSEPKRTNHINRLIAGDVDDDGIPEIVTTYRNGNNSPTEGVINILQAPLAGATLLLDKQINTLADGLPPTFEDIAMADINKDGCAEIFILSAESDGVNYKIIAYNCNGTKVWTNPINFSFYPGTMGLADFDGDGAVELYTRTQIYDAHSGTLMGENIFGGSLPKNSNAPIAVDILPASSTMELVAGCRIYEVNINRPAPPPAIPPVNGSTLTLSKQRTEYFTRKGRTSGSGTSVADFNLDGYLDVVAVGSLNDDASNNNQTTTIFFWDVQNDQLKTYTDYSITGDSRYTNGWQNGAGRINLADIDGDGKMNAVYVSGKFLYALKETGSALDTLWRRGVTEETSGYTGCTMFDFNADGKSEIVYRDEDYIYIYTTTNNSGTVTVTRSTPVRCASRTSNEYPIVVDMNGDGSTEICVTCAVNESVLGKNHDLWDDAEVRVYESANVPWVPARKLWNQHGYFVVNVNDDLTIPKKIQGHHLIYAENADCFSDKTSRPLNNFLNQAPFLDSYGCPSFPAPNLAVTPFGSGMDVQVNPPTCPDKNFTVSFKFRNKGDIGVSGNLPVSFYNGNPMAAGAKLLGTTIVPLSSMNPGDTITRTNVTITGPGSSFTLYIVLNDNGTTIPSPITIPNPKTAIKECDYGDNILKADINPLPVTLNVQLIRDNLKCASAAPGIPPSPDNGAVKAYVTLSSGLKDSVNFKFYWSKGTVAKPIASADHVGFTYTGLPAGTYTVYAVHKTANCSSDTVSINVGETSRTIDVKVIDVQNSDNCKNPNGVLQAIVNDTDGDGVGEPVGKFNYVWFAGPDILVGDTLGLSHTLTSLKPGTYSVLVVDKATGCGGNDSESITGPLPYTIDTTHVDITCSATNSGSATATVGGTVSGYTFSWFNGKNVLPTASFTGSSYTNLGAGSYTVFASNNASKCNSDTVTVTVKQTKPPVITGITKDSDQLSCTGNIGAATVNVQGTASDYTYQWYKGPNTVTPIVGATNPSITGQPSGTYTVKVTGKTSGCSSTAQITLTGPVPSTIVSVVATGQSTCSPNNSQIEVQSVSPDTPSDYTFEWYEGTSVIASKLIASSQSSILTGVAPGTYTVRAKHKKYGCVTPAVQAQVLNNIPNIAINSPTLSAPNDCNSADGAIEVDVATASVLGYDFHWYRGFTVTATSVEITANVVSTSSTSKVSLLKYGQYVVEITNRDTGCKKEFPIYLPFLNGHILSPFSQTDITTCVPDNGGSITAELKPTVGFTDADYIVEYFEGSVDPESAPGTGIAVTSVNPSPNAGNYLFDSNGPFNTVTKYYTMVATAGATTGSLQGCRASATFAIKQTVTDPVIDANTTAAAITENKFCKTSVPGNMGSGSITLALGSGSNAADYDYQWTSSTDASFSAITKDLTDLKPGDYTVTVTDNGGVNAGCFTTNVFSVLDDPMVVTVNIANGDMTFTNLTQCGPDGITALTQGTAAFQQIVVDGSPVASPFAGYTFDWRKVDNTAIADNDAIIGDIGNLPAGDFYVTATDNTSHCDVTASFTIEDETLNSITAALLNFVVPSKCLKPTNILGELEVEASGLPGTSYTYSWFLGSTTTTPLPAANVTGQDSNGNPGNIAQTINPGFFTVQVENNASHCKVWDTYQLSQDTAVITMTASASPLTFCSAPDGTTYAIITSSTPNDYDYEWYIGTTVKATPDYTGKLVENLTQNKYLVVVTDKLDADCTLSDTVEVEDLRIYPVVTAEPTSPRTNCDIVKADGVASASVGGNIIDYSFDWYGKTITPPPFATGSQVGDLRDSTYTVIASDIVTGCSDTTQVTIQFVPAGIDQPTIEVISQVTSCVEDNGALQASVNGNTTDYIFEWYIGQTVKASPDFVGSLYDSLAIGIYTVRATSIITGCVSDPVSEEIIFDPTLPQFDIAALPASCEGEDGQIILTLTNSVDIDEIIWESDNGTIIGDPILNGIPAGHYKVTVITQLGCRDSKEIDVINDIHPYNGVSRNGDGKNDIFYINCIADFPDNIVKIYNRAGTLVYEHEGYNNIDIFFDGKSNKGISMMGTNLPDGTYFYIIDKRNGSKPLAGYLEIVN
ncbi:MAG TPA: gliding motility-associated C-terminal domain-containing protein [Ohtaekwangia sp.]|uniref:T9SS type B sorting domain-containing protein n=1 Tax=Ohtaekwangia sp. TaxID=2066019 RepID=UPI002F91CCA9